MNITNVRCRWRIGNEFGRKTVGGFTKRFRGVRSKERVNESVGERISKCAIEFNGDISYIYIVRGRDALLVYIYPTRSTKRKQKKRERERESMTFSQFLSLAQYSRQKFSFLPLEEKYY